MEIIDENTGKKRTLSCSKGRYTKRELQEFRNKMVEVEYEFGTQDKPKLLRISLFNPGNTLHLP